MLEHHKDSQTLQAFSEIPRNFTDLPIIPSFLILTMHNTLIDFFMICTYYVTTPRFLEHWKVWISFDCFPCFWPGTVMIAGMCPLSFWLLISGCTRHFARLGISAQPFHCEHKDERYACLAIWQISDLVNNLTSWGQWADKTYPLWWYRAPSKAS